MKRTTGHRILLTDLQILHATFSEVLPTQDVIASAATTAAARTARRPPATGPGLQLWGGGTARPGSFRTRQRVLDRARMHSHAESRSTCPASAGASSFRSGFQAGNGTTLQIWDCGPTSNQVWRWNVNTKAIVGEHSGRCLDVWGASTANGAPVTLYDCHGGTNQQWEWQGDGSLRGVGSGKCLDVVGYGTGNGATLQIWDCHGGANQIWWTT